MFRTLILPIFRNTRLCVTACGIMHPMRYRPTTSWVRYITTCNTQSSAPEDGRDQRPKHVELIGIINKPLLLHLVGDYINDGRSKKNHIVGTFLISRGTVFVCLAAALVSCTCI